MHVLSAEKIEKFNISIMFLTTNRALLFIIFEQKFKRGVLYVIQDKCGTKEAEGFLLILRGR